MTSATDIERLFNTTENFLQPPFIPPNGLAFQLKYSYLPFHGLLSLFVCIFGTIANVANILVLTRKEMISPTNSILTGLALADMLVMLDYIPFTLHNYLLSEIQTSEELFSHSWAVFALFHAHFSVVCHAISTWLTVLLAVWRYISVRRPAEARIWCNQKRALMCITATYVCVVIACIPVYLSFTITPRTVGSTTTYRVGWSEIAFESNQLLKKVNFWVFSVATKLVPCFLLTYLSLALISTLIEADRRKERLQNPRVYRDDSCLSSDKIRSAVPRKRSSISKYYAERTNRMLVAVLLLFLVTEFPSGILVLLSGVVGDDFFQEVYSPLGEILDILALINSSINFILYCTMSSAFRKTFKDLFCSFQTTSSPANVRILRRSLPKNHEHPIEVTNGIKPSTATLV